MARLSNDGMDAMNLNQLRQYAEDHPKEAFRVAKRTGLVSAECLKISANHSKNRLVSKFNLNSPWSQEINC